MSQGTYIPEDPRIPADTLDWDETMAWYAKLPQIGRTSHAVDAWREIDALQQQSKPA